MGVTPQSFELLIREHLDFHCMGKLVTFGRQDMHGSYGHHVNIMQRCGRMPKALPPGMMPESTALDRIIWAHLGYNLTALDISDYQNADILHDLNEPIPLALHGRFDTLFDGGTTEHIFDVRQALKNTVDLVRTGGRIIHAVPTNNQINHGFYQFSPTLYFDYYAANGFTDMRAHLAVIPTRLGEALWAIVPYDHEKDFGIENFFNTEDNYTVVFFSATKGINATNHVVPSQKWYTDGNFRRGKQLVFDSSLTSMTLEPLRARV